MKPCLTAAQARRLRPKLETLVDELDAAERVQSDPVMFPRRYRAPADQEVAALYASVLAFGRVGLFSAVLEQWFAWLDARGGPAAATLSCEVADATDVFALQYRWTRGPDLVLLMLATQDLLRTHGDLQSAFGMDGSLGDRLEVLVQRLRSAAVRRAGEVGQPVQDYRQLPRGLRHLLAAPSGKSACKRWHMLLRWLVRSDDGVDLGLWGSVQAADLLVPVDTHVHRVARMLNLTNRSQADWRTSEQITAGLRRLDASDPVRFDFALAHLGISGACAGERVVPVCTVCPLESVCRETPRR